MLVRKASLQNLAWSHIGNVQHKAPPPPAPKSVLDHVDPITYRGGPVNSTKRQQLVGTAGFPVKKIKPRKPPDPADIKKKPPNKPINAHDFPRAVRNICIGQEAYFDYVGDSFIDRDDESRWLIIGICEYNKNPGELVYEYVEWHKKVNVDNISEQDPKLVAEAEHVFFEQDTFVQWCKKK
jgi:hypothetical protein